MAKVAKEKIDRVIMEDIERNNLIDYFQQNYFDFIIFADVLEHLKDPWAVLKNVTNFLTSSGFIITSIPNVRNYTTIINLVKGYWPYRERGIHDKTHLRFFTFKNIKKMLLDADYTIFDCGQEERYEIKMSKKILVTGGAGFIGSYLCEKLLENDYNVICVDSFNDYYDP